MQFHVTCSCGETIPVAAVDAGGTAACRCGKVNAVPALSQLRRQAGMVAYEVPAADRIRLLQKEGCLAAQACCAGCGGEATVALTCRIVCEKSHTKRRGGMSLGAALSLLISCQAWLMHRMLHGDDDGDRVTHGRDVIVDAPLRLCTVCMTSAAGQRNDLRELLLRVPHYEQLLREYPDAQIRGADEE